MEEELEVEEAGFRGRGVDVLRLVRTEGSNLNGMDGLFEGVAALHDLCQLKLVKNWQNIREIRAGDAEC